MNFHERKGEIGPRSASQVSIWILLKRVPYSTFSAPNKASKHDLFGSRFWHFQNRVGPSKP
jgi:hypothetical protein